MSRILKFHFAEKLMKKFLKANLKMEIMKMRAMVLSECAAIETNPLKAYRNR